MKTILILILSASMTLAATLTIDVPNADIPRMTEAYGSILGLGRPANQAEIENAIRHWLIGSTKDYERRKNMAQFSPPPTELTPAPTPTPTPGGMAAPASFKAAPKVTATPKKKK